MIQAFAAKFNSDSTEGRGHMVTEGIFTLEADAAKAVSHHTFMGGAPNSEVVPVLVFESFEEYLLTQHNKLRNSALAKLTAAERKALGV